MSRHELSPLPGCEGYEIAVGWDPPLATFFACVGWADEEDEREPALWIGTSPGEVRDLDVIAAAVRPYAIVPIDTLRNLYAEAHA